MKMADKKDLIEVNAKDTNNELGVPVYVGMEYSEFLLIILSKLSISL